MVVESLAILTGQGAEGALLAMLVAGHVAADFLFQTKDIVRAKEDGELTAFLFHGGIVGIVHLFFLLSFWSLPILVVSGLLGLAHVIIDAGKLWASRHTRFGQSSMLLFLGDQTLHLASLAGVWLVLTPLSGVDLLFSSLAPPPGGWGVLTTVGVLFAVYLFTLQGGRVLVRRTLDFYVETEESNRDQRGAAIGILERLLILTLVLVDQWTVIGLYIGTKPFARIQFSEPAEAEFREYYLIGTLASVGLAILAGLLTLVLL